MATSTTTTERISSTTVSTTTSERTLSAIQSIQYIRASSILLDVAGARPNTQLHVFFDGVLVDQYCAPRDLAGASAATVGSNIPTNIALNTPVISDSNGNAVITFSIPAATFTTGDKTVLVTEVTDLELLALPGTVYGSARSVYTTRGTLETYQRITTTTNTTTNVDQMTIVERSDPLAQSFFTHGVKGGMFVTAIELFFQSKDPVIPIQVELREMSMGFPKELDRSNPDLVSVVKPDQITTNTVGQMAAGTAVGTKFRFNPPVYLKEDGDFCFVVFTNSNKYNIYTSKMGETSLENGKTILSQPYVGSLFKSENNYTWTAEQTEDIKFNIYKAKFSLSQGTVPLYAEPVRLNVSGSKMYTAGKATSTTVPILYYGELRHGMVVGDYISIGADSTGVYNGIPGANLTGDFPITSIIDDYTVEFTITVDAGVTVTAGYLEHSSIVRAVHVINGGAGYNTAPALSFSPSASGGTSSTATAHISNGKIAYVTVTRGTGTYATTPTIVINDAGTGGSGASLQVSSAAQFNVSLNVAYSFISPHIMAASVASSNISSDMKNLSNAAYVTETRQTTHRKVTDMEAMYRLANRYNENLRISGASSLEMNLHLSTDNPNVSPIFDMRTPPKLVLGSIKLNDQHSTNYVDTVGGIARITNLVGGTGYTGSPTVVAVNAPNDVTGAGATFTATTNAGAITAITITNPGSGYTANPTLVITGTGTGASASCELYQTAQNGSIQSVTLSTAGSGYTGSTVACTVTPAKNDFTGTGASVTANVSGGAITGFNILNAGTGYTQTPTITVAAPSSGTTATAQVVLTPFNTEAGGKGDPRGSAYSRYLTKKISLATISTGIKLIAQIDSSPETSVDVYIRTSLSGSNTNHVDQGWQLLSCDVQRNKSAYRGQFFEYTFYNDNLIPFDVYDLKFVLSSSDASRTPIVGNYRVIISV